MKKNIVKPVFGVLLAVILLASVFLPIAGALNNDVNAVETTIPEIEIIENSRTSQIVQIGDVLITLKVDQDHTKGVLNIEDLKTGMSKTSNIEVNKSKDNFSTTIASVGEPIVTDFDPFEPGTTAQILQSNAKAIQEQSTTWIWDNIIFIDGRNGFDWNYPHPDYKSYNRNWNQPLKIISLTGDKLNHEHIDSYTSSGIIKLSAILGAAAFKVLIAYSFGYTIPKIIEDGIEYAIKYFISNVILDETGAIWFWDSIGSDRFAYFRISVFTINDKLGLGTPRPLPDTIPPIINSILLSKTLNDYIKVTVNVTDNVKVTKVTANGVLLTNNPNNQDIWNGDIIADPTVHVVTQDSFGNEATADTSYQPGEGYWYQGSGGVALDIGQASIVDLKSPRNVNNAYIQVGCNDGESMDGYIGYLEAGTWKNLISFTGAGCGQYLDFPVVTTTSLKLVMTGGGGSDGRISWYSVGSNGWKVYAIGPQIFLDRLNPGDSLKIDQFILSQNGRFKLIMQEDGNLVLYDLNTRKARWATGTNGKPVSFTIMQGDGNLVLYNSNYKPYWDSKTWGYPGAWLIVQNDGNVVIYDVNYKPLWATGTNG